ncbi:unnamed protein product [Rodentolepis nana]|uniref:Thiolase_C domain-containing protein n=1 Tax=Rodentolepis nana TaxID=102285 RepID=A0A0R3T2H8_RODNA|nr:unnamed protein product [Rodentolepis nana]
MSDHENTDAWSSDGDSASSESFTSSDSESRTNGVTKSVRHLKHTGVLEGTELIDHAIDRWTTYSQLCDRGIASLRDTMVDSYVKKAIETKPCQIPSRHDSAETVSKSITLSGDSPSLSKSLHRSNQKLAELRAFRRIGRPSKRAENAKHATATSRFAIFSSNLAPWRPMGASSQKCLYRDPTISTWEYKCCKPSIPLLPYCAEHLVLSEEPAGNPPAQSQLQHQNPITPGSPPSMAFSLSNQPDIEIAGEAGANISQQQVLPSPTTVTSDSVSSDRKLALSPVGKGKLESGKPQKPTSKKSTSTKSRSGADGNTGQNEIQFVPQYLFRKCGGGPNNDCSQPVINWTDSTRCHLHTTFSNLFPLPPKKEEEGILFLWKMPDGYADSDVLIVSACRTPIGRFCGCLASIATHELGGTVISECIKRASKQFVDQTEEEVLSHVTEVIMGQVYTAGGGQNPARQAAKSAVYHFPCEYLPKDSIFSFVSQKGLSYTVPAWGLNMLCASGMKAVCQCFQTLRLEGGMAVAGGQESMSRCPHITPPGCSLRRGGGGGNADGLPIFGDFRLMDSLLNDGLEDAFYGIHMGVTAENIAQKFHIRRIDQDAFAYESQARCKQAVELGKFKSEIAPVSITKTDKRGIPIEPIIISLDEPPRPQTTMEALARLPPAFANGLPQSQDGTVTAGNASALADGAAALLLCRGDTAKNLGLRCPLGRIMGWHQSGCEPLVMGLGPIDAVKGLMDKLSWSVEDVSLFELNEAFAAQSLAVLNELGLPKDRTNVNGGAIALGHPIGCSGARILVTLVHSLHRLAHSSSKIMGVDSKETPLRGIAALCVGGGMGLAIAVEILPHLTSSNCPLIMST